MDCKSANQPKKEHYASEKHKREIALHCREELDLAQAFCTQEQGTALRIYTSWHELSTPAVSLGRSNTGNADVAEETSVLTHIQATLMSPGRAEV